MSYQFDVVVVGAGVICLACAKYLVEQAQVTHQGFEIRPGGEDPSTVNARCLINAAGLYAVSVAKGIDGLAVNHTPQTFFAKGN